MKINTARLISKCSRSFKVLILLCLLLSFTASACGGTPATQAPTVPTTAIPSLAIVTGGPCEVALGASMPLNVTGMPGTDVVYSWTASAGNVNPPDKSAVVYTAPNTPGDVIITVVAQRGELALEAFINCQVIGPTMTPENTATLAPTLTPVPSPTLWACSSFRSEKLQSADIPGEVIINIPAQAAMDLPSGRNVQVAGSHTGIPEGHYVWVFIYSKDAGQHGRYYPQTREAVQGWQPDPTTGQNGGWDLNVNFGAPNLCYELIVMVANAEASLAIAEQLQRWAAAKDYTGYELNGPSSAEAPDPPGFPDGLVEKASIEVKTR